MRKQKFTAPACLVCKTQQIALFTYQKKYEYWKCTRCGLVSTYPIPDKKAINTHYRKKFKRGNYELLQKYAHQYKVVYESFVNDIEKELGGENGLKNIKVLDIGCFTGELLELMQEKGADVYGLELQEDAVMIANKKLHGRVYKADVMSSKLPKQKFHVITLIGLIEHVTDPMKLLIRCSELLYKDGLLFIQTPNSGSLFARLLRQYWPPYAPVEHIHLFSHTSLEQALQRTHFRDISFKQSWKILPIAYVFNMMQNFGSEFYRIAKPLSPVFNHPRFRVRLPLYIGEMVMMGRKIDVNVTTKTRRSLSKA